MPPIKLKLLNQIGVQKQNKSEHRLGHIAVLVEIASSTGKRNFFLCNNAFGQHLLLLLLLLFNIFKCRNIKL
ncbi:hypothetical protein IEQ34_004786 [Dendrobium chrysotoxum]|uniref:Uncharacterized protein n=1 Tax=Dendrobium chrysotoxum TaxID=161865 RepID=A0AAV7H9I0_DENCH|nr:hypothetical protein IEQ34_004786 [Dendrobium chrysotoxum]